jgi:glycosyltransferase involved in cell wall biosynthesis
LITDDYLPPAVARIFRFLCRLVPRFVIANSDATLRALALPRQYETSSQYSQKNLSAKAATIHDGVCVGDYQVPSIAPTGTQTKVGLIGRISPWKGQHVFIRAAAKLCKKFPDCKFQIIGDALFGEQAYDEELRKLVRDLELTDSVEFTGFCQDIPATIAKLDIVVHASTIGEPFGQVIIEGMASRKPVIATKGGGVPEIVLDGITGLLVPMSDVDALSDAIERLLTKPELAQRMGVAALDRVRSHFSIEHTARKIECLYDALVGAAVRN